MYNKRPNILVLNPYSQGFFVFTKLAAGDLEHQRSTNCTQEICQTVCQLPKPRLAIYIGWPCERLLGQLICHETDFCTIPLAWMSHIPFRKVNERAQFATHLAKAYLTDPISLFGAKEPPQ